MSAIPASTKLSALSDLLTQLQGLSGDEDKREGMRGTPKGKGHSKIFEDARQEARDREAQKAKARAQKAKIFEDARQEARDREAQKAINTPKVAPKAINTPKVAPKAKRHSEIFEATLQEARDRTQARDHDAYRDAEREAYTKYHTEHDQSYASNHTYAELHAGL
jgi:hypothetical protein